MFSHVVCILRSTYGLIQLLTDSEYRERAVKDYTNMDCSADGVMTRDWGRERKERATGRLSGREGRARGKGG